MTKTLLSAALIAGLGIAALAPQAAHAATPTVGDGTINITGTVTAGTCKVNGGSPATVAVGLPTVQTSALLSAGAVAGRTPFSLAITACAAGVNGATTYFEPGPTIDTTNGNLVGGGSSNVQVQLLNGAGSSAVPFSQIQLGNPLATQNSGQVAIASGGATLNYYAQYFAKTAATPGSVSTSVQFTMIYN